MNENNEKNLNEEETKLPEEQKDSNEQPSADEREYYEKQYFSGDSLKEIEGNDDEDDEEENQYLSSFDKANTEGLKKKSRGMKKQIITLICVFAAAAIMIGLYLFVFKDDSTTEQPQYYAVSEKCSEILEKLDKDVTFSFSNTEEELDKDTYGYFVKEFARTFAKLNEKITLVYGSGNDYCKISCGSKSVVYTENDFFNTLENGKRFSFNGEILYSKAVIETAGISGYDAETELMKWALPGYDLDGDTLGSGNRPFIYPNITRAEVESLVITNTYGTYKVYRGKNTDGSYSNTFYFENAELCGYDQELFASLMVNCTYMLAYAKVPNPKPLEEYGLASESDATGMIEVYTLDGNYHKIIIGDSLPTGGGYYAKYYNKDCVYVLDSSYAGDVLQPATTFLTANLGYTISNTNDTYKISDILLRYLKNDTDIYIDQKQDVVITPNFKNYNSEQTLASLFIDKVYASGEYSDWTADAKTFAGFKSSDGNECVIELQLTNYAKDTNEYAVKFGLVRDSEKQAYLPRKVVVKVYDGDTKEWNDVASADVFTQGEKSYKQYTLSFKSEKQVKYIRLFITCGDGYVVMDEITPYADGKDAIPNEGVMGIWKIVSPESYIREGFNYAVPDTSTFSEILYGISTLTGDEVVEYNLYSGTEEEVKAKMQKYGLDEPAVIISYMYDIYRSFVYFSDLQTDENGNRFYYAYAVISYTEDGKDYNISSNIIAKINYDTAYYLSWDAIDLLERSVFSMYIDKIDTIETTFGGNSYLFTILDEDENGKKDAVKYDGKYLNMQNFRYVYVSVLECSRVGIYTPNESDISDENLIFTFKMHSEVKDTTIKFYRVSSTKVVYCYDDQPSEFYVLYSDVSTVMSNVLKVINGEDVHR